MKYCPYCGLEHGRRGKYCSPEHAKRAGAQLATASRQRNAARRRILAAGQERLRYRDLWRGLIFGTDDGTAVATIFDPATRRKRAKRLRASNPASTLSQQR